MKLKKIIELYLLDKLTYSEFNDVKIQINHYNNIKIITRDISLTINHYPIHLNVDTSLGEVVRNDLVRKIVEILNSKFEFEVINYETL